jgi:hypothetical protein
LRLSRPVGYKFVEAADLSIGGLILVKKGQIILVKYHEELIPAYLFEIFFGFAEIHAKYSTVVRRLDACWPPLSRFNPFADLTVVLGTAGLAQGFSPGSGALKQ